MAKMKLTSEIKLSQNKNGFFIASLFINGVLNHSTYPQHSERNAIMLINRYIERFNAMNEVRFPLYGQKAGKPRRTNIDRVSKAAKTRMFNAWKYSLERFIQYSEIRKLQAPKNRQKVFTGADLQRDFGIHPYTRGKAVKDGLLAEPVNIVWQGHRVMASSFDDLKKYFERIEVMINEHNRGMGTQNVQ